MYTRRPRHSVGRPSGGRPGRPAAAQYRCTATSGRANPPLSPHHRTVGPDDGGFKPCRGAAGVTCRYSWIIVVLHIRVQLRDSLGTCRCSWGTGRHSGYNSGADCVTWFQLGYILGRAYVTDRVKFGNNLGKVGVGSTLEVQFA